MRRLFCLLLIPLSCGATLAPLDDRLAAGVGEWVDAPVTTGQFSTGSVGFDQEWVFGTWQMAALGFLQHARAHPEHRDADLQRVHLCIDRMLGAEGRAFDSLPWGEDPLNVLEKPRGHIAWLGYTNLVLSATRALEEESVYADINDRLTEAIVRRFETEPLPETYPGERYPLDSSAAAASVGLYDRVTGANHREMLEKWTTNLRGPWRAQGGLVQAIGPNGEVRDHPRGSGTFLASWFVSWWNPALASEIYTLGKRTFLQDFGLAVAMREYPPGENGGEDIDSGPIVGGLGVSASGFAIGAAHAVGDHDTAVRLERLAESFGAPVDEGSVRHWGAGIALGGAPVADSILFAMFTTPLRLASP